MGISKHEVVKEYVFWVDGLPHTVKGRILIAHGPNVSEPYQWQISHHCTGSEKAGIYHPSVVSAKSIEDAERLLFAYANSFTNRKVILNEDY